MMYPYMELGDKTEIVHSHIIEEDGINKVIVHFEQPTINGFHMARCELPSYAWIETNGFSQERLKQFQELLEHNAHLIYRYAEEGGIHIA